MGRLVWLVSLGGGGREAGCTGGGHMRGKAGNGWLATNSQQHVQHIPTAPLTGGCMRHRQNSRSCTVGRKPPGTSQQAATSMATTETRPLTCALQRGKHGAAHEAAVDLTRARHAANQVVGLPPNSTHVRQQNELGSHRS